MTASWILLSLVVFLIAANALFVAAEFSLVAVDRPTIANLADDGDRRAKSVRSALRTLSTQLSGAQLGITITSLVVGSIAEPSIATLLRGGLEPFALPDGAALAVSMTAAFLIATTAQMVFGELVPKNWAIAEPVKVGRSVAGAQRGFSWVSKPLIAFLNGAANTIVRRLGIEPQEELASARSAQELAALATRSADQGMLESDVAQRVAHSIALGERTAADAMTPRPRVHFVDDVDTAADVLDLAARTGYSRFPLVGETVDDILGVVHFKHALTVPRSERGSTPVGEIAVPVRSLPAVMRLDSVLERLREGIALAVVVDEYGGTDGIVTLEDIIEEIVGGIADEQDRPESRARRLEGDRWSLPGMIRPDEAGEAVSMRLPEGTESDTLSGLLTERLERFPEPGDAITVEASDLAHVDESGLPLPIIVRMTVESVDGHRAEQVILERVEPVEDVDV
ncbi:hemolysin family protein [Haloglycomyces albus]|uniref:hemolysin family protein n=1 Tax=Haloglycomyces albus TaxID=526067 RepID=UPI00046C91E8|nr:hemolysin family protein [Haloglycomyces albus]